MENLTNLQELWLGRNRIKAVNLCGLKCLKKISLQSNRLTSMTGFEVCYLKMIDISHFNLQDKHPGAFNHCCSLSTTFLLFS